MLVSPDILLQDAARHNYAVAAFNFYNMDSLSAVLRAAEQEQAPIIAQIYDAHFTYYDGGDTIAAFALEAIRRCSMPVALHLDHSNSYENVLKAIRCGFTSVMFDGSALPLEENIAITAKVVEVAHSLGVYTEAELGRIIRIGSPGAEDLGSGDYTSVEDAVALVRATGVDSFAPAIGTAHGIYTKEPHIQFERLQAIYDAVQIPLVLHGGSGIGAEAIGKSISCGVRKVNVGTELKYMWSKTMLDHLRAGEKEIIQLSRHASVAVQEVAAQKIRMLGASGRAADLQQFCQCSQGVR